MIHSMGSHSEAQGQLTQTNSAHKLRKTLPNFREGWRRWRMGSGEFYRLMQYLSEFCDTAGTLGMFADVISLSSWFSPAER